MAAQITVLRGPVINSTYNPSSSSPEDSLIYFEDAIIILSGNTILEFGPTKTLKHKVANIKDIKLNQECRIIRSVVSKITQ